jgi:hypothetical protein
LRHIHIFDGPFGHGASGTDAGTAGREPFRRRQRKLPPVNWVRSRKIDVKNIALDLSFDWAKEQAIGTELITFARLRIRTNSRLTRR